MNTARLHSLAASIAIAMAVVTATAFGHVERSSYWPDPAPDTSVKPAAGGKVPKARSLASALRSKPPGKTRVVCQRGSLRKAVRSINSARKNGTVLRPSQGTKKLTAGDAVTGGLKAQVFTRIDPQTGMRAVIVTDANNREIAEIRLFPRKKTE